MIMEKSQKADYTKEQVNLSIGTSKQNKTSSSDEPEYNLEQAGQGEVWMTMKVVIQPFETITVKDKVKLNTHTKSSSTSWSNL